MGESCKYMKLTINVCPHPGCDQMLTEEGSIQILQEHRAILTHLDENATIEEFDGTTLDSDLYCSQCSEPLGPYAK